jgi:hypothetical protein
LVACFVGEGAMVAVVPVVRFGTRERARARGSGSERVRKQAPGFLLLWHGSTGPTPAYGS